MDLHQIGTGLGIPSRQHDQQQQHSSTPTPSSSVSPSTRQHPQHFQHHQLYNLVPQAPYSPGISSWPRSRNLQHQQQQQQLYQPQQSNVKREVMGKHLDSGNGSRNTDDSMPSTSDFVKKLYKFVSFYSFSISFSTKIDFIFVFTFDFFMCVFVGCWKILRFKMLYLGDRWVIVLLSKYVYCYFFLYPCFTYFFF
jgi:hypothetical protein